MIIHFNSTILKVSRRVTNRLVEVPHTIYYRQTPHFTNIHGHILHCRRNLPKFIGRTKKEQKKSNYLIQFKFNLKKFKNLKIKNLY